MVPTCANTPLIMMEVQIRLTLWTILFPLSFILPV